MLIGFILGLSSTFHCLGMCGPIAMAIPVNRSSNLTILSGALQYNFGRIFSYLLIGVVGGTIGLSFASLRWMQWLTILAGLLMILIAWHKILGLGQVKFVGGITTWISRNIGKLMRSKSPLKLIGLGSLNGLLPCGMVFMGLSNAMIQSTPFEGGLAMLFFGLGTLPIMFSVVFFSSKISGSWRFKFTRFVPYLMTIIGLLVILRGLNLGIPYLSPELKVVEQKGDVNSQSSNQKIEMICCTPENSNDGSDANE